MRQLHPIVVVKIVFQEVASHPDGWQPPAEIPNADVDILIDVAVTPGDDKGKFMEMAIKEHSICFLLSAQQPVSNTLSLIASPSSALQSEKRVLVLKRDAHYIPNVLLLLRDKRLHVKSKKNLHLLK